MPASDAGPDDERRVAEVALAHRAPLGAELRARSRRRSSRRGRSKPSPRSASRLRSVAPSSSAVDSRTVAKRQCSTSSVAVEGAEVGLGVADVDDEEHRRDYRCQPRWPPSSTSFPHRIRARAVERALRAQGDRATAGRPAPGDPARRSRRSRFGQGTVPALEFDSGRGRRIAADRRARSTAAVPEPPLLPGRPDARAAASRTPSAGATRSSRPPCARLVVGRARAPLGRDAVVLRGLRPAAAGRRRDAQRRPRRAHRGPAPRRRRGAGARRRRGAAGAARRDRRLDRRGRDRRRARRTPRTCRSAPACGCCSRSGTCARSSRAGPRRRTRARCSRPTRATCPPACCRPTGSRSVSPAA